MLDCLVRGRTASETARQFDLGLATIRTHTASLGGQINGRRTQDVVVRMIIEGWPRTPLHA